MTTKKTTKRSTKNTKFIPDFVVDYRNLTSIEDVYYVFAEAKFENEIALNEQELKSIISKSVSEGYDKGYFEAMVSVITSDVIQNVIQNNTVEQKEGGRFKRIFDSIKSKFNKLFRK